MVYLRPQSRYVRFSLSKRMCVCRGFYMFLFPPWSRRQAAARLMDRSPPISQTGQKKGYIGDREYKPFSSPVSDSKPPEPFYWSEFGCEGVRDWKIGPLDGFIVFNDGFDKFDRFASRFPYAATRPLTLQFPICVGRPVVLEWINRCPFGIGNQRGLKVINEMFNIMALFYDKKSPSRCLKKLNHYVYRHSISRKVTWEEKETGLMVHNAWPK